MKSKTSQSDVAKEYIQENGYITGRWQQWLLKAVSKIEESKEAVDRRVSIKQIWKYVRMARFGMKVLSFFFGFTLPSFSGALKDILKEIARILSSSTQQRCTATAV